MKKVKNMKITSEDCVKAIVKNLIDSQNNFTNLKDWKRISKKGTGNNIVRKFQNKISNREIYVRSSESEILEISNDSFENNVKKRIDNFDDFLNGKKIDCNDPRFLDRSVLERIFSSEEWDDEYIPKKFQNPKEWGSKHSIEYDDSDELLNDTENWIDNHSWNMYFVHPNIKSFKRKKVKAFCYIINGSTCADINIFMVGDIIIGWYYHED